MLSRSLERRFLQFSLALAACVPVYGGLTGALRQNPGVGPMAEGHFNYLSGLLLGLGLALWASVPRIERHGARVRLLTALVVLGGLARLLAAARRGAVDELTLFTLGMELVVTPALCLWQARVASTFSPGNRGRG